MVTIEQRYAATKANLICWSWIPYLKNTTSLFSTTWINRPPTPCRGFVCREPETYFRIEPR